MSESAAERTTAAVLQAIGERLAGRCSGEVAKLLRSCPLRAGRLAAQDERAALIASIADQTQTTPREAERLARSVLATVRGRLTADEAAQVRARLGGIAELWS